MVRVEAAQSKKEIEKRLREKVLPFSYPAGHYTEDVKHIIEESEYNYGVTQDRGINNLDNRYGLKRINIWEGTGSFSNGKFSKALFALRLSGI
jgi:hypothetical protein